MENLSSMRVDGERLWQSLMEMAQIGATKKGGCNRQTLTDEDKQGRDPFMAAAPIIAGCYEIAEQYAPWGCATFGDIKAEPGSRNTVPERLTVNVDLRHPDAEILDRMDRTFRDLV
jgi:metal-dependent amidase/aminoacylase/carboxypeptidase family protein